MIAKVSALILLAVMMAASAFALLLSAPLFGAYAAGQNSSSQRAAPVLTPSIVPPVNTGVLKDPSGTYTFTYLGHGQYLMNLTVYEDLQHDPYSNIASNSQIQINGTTVIITVPQSNTSSFNLSHPAN